MKFFRPTTLSLVAVLICFLGYESCRPVAPLAKPAVSQPSTTPKIVKSVVPAAPVVPVVRPHVVSPPSAPAPTAPLAKPKPTKNEPAGRWETRTYRGGLFGRRTWTERVWVPAMPAKQQEAKWQGGAVLPDKPGQLPIGIDESGEVFLVPQNYRGTSNKSSQRSYCGPGGCR